MENKDRVSSLNTFLYVPNIIEYMRLSLLFLMFCYAFNAPVFSIACIICANLDAIDGYAARRLKQESYLGVVLDYTIDRISIALLLIILIVLYPNQWQFFSIILLLDIASHFCQLYSSVFFQLSSHKKLGSQQGRLLNLYYSNGMVCYYACISHDLWLGSFYLYYYYGATWWVTLLTISLFPGFIFKIIIHILQIYTSLKLIAAMTPNPRCDDNSAQK